MYATAEHYFNKYLFVISISLISLSFILPDFAQPWVSFTRQMLAFMAVLAMLPLRRGKQNATGAVYWFAFMAVIAAWSHLFGNTAFHSIALINTLYMFGLILAWGNGEILSRNQKRLEVAVAAFLGMSLFQAAVCWVQWLGYSDESPLMWPFIIPSVMGERTLANMGQPNHAAIVLSMGVACGLFLHHKGKLSLPALAVTFFMFALTIPLTLSKAGMLSLLCIWGYCLFLWLKRSSLIKTASFALYSLFMACCGTLFAYMPQITTTWWGDAAVASASISANTVHSRILIYKQLWAAISESPWLGYGWQNTLLAAKQGALSVQGNEPVTYAHNLFIDLAVWCGIPFAVLFAISLIIWIVKYALLNTNSNSLLVAILIPFGVASMVEYEFAYAYFAFWAAFLMGAIQNGIDENRAISHRKLSQSIIWLAAVGVLTVGVIIVSIYYLTAKEQALRINFKLAQLPTDSFSIEYVPVLDQLDTWISIAEVPIDESISDRDIRRLKQISDSIPSPLIQYRYILALGLIHSPEFEKEMKSFSGIHKDAFCRDMLIYLENEPELSEEQKQLARKILQPPNTSQMK